MAKVLTFRAPTRIRRVHINNRERHTVFIRVTNRMLAKVTRWQSQYAIQRGCGFGGLKGWTDRRAHTGAWFKVRIRTGLLDRFLLDLELVMTARTLEIWVDDRQVRVAA
ncbi:hypothetical protein [Sphingomonas sp.]|jgi:hypothetical protein|uniref:hypothetical protein n=1 Tax=Sphingomonas sp. TaxID=28214 RepID=UPI002DEFF165|nr:hypothetical protein [Sphingomonas sp.]